MQRKQIVAGNWKMNNDLSQTKSLLLDLKNQQKGSNAEVMVAPTFTNLSVAVEVLQNSNIEVISQNIHFAENGAYTGEVSASMLKSIDVNTTILGHSERRDYFNETSELLVKKINQALAHNMRIIFCFGEQLQDRKNENHFKVVEDQIKEALFHLELASWKHIVLAYEPVWAIGTGETATPEQAQEMHAFIRNIVKNKYGSECSESLSILYGGSVKPNNAREIFSNPDVDGGLIGGASLKAEDFFCYYKCILKDVRYYLYRLLF